MFLGKICHLVRTIFLCSAFRSIYILKCIHISAHFKLGLPLFARGSYPPLFRLFFFYLSLEPKVLKNPKCKISWLNWQRFCIFPSTAHWQLKYLSWLPSGFTGFCLRVWKPFPRLWRLALLLLQVQPYFILSSLTILNCAQCPVALPSNLIRSIFFFTWVFQQQFS